MSTIKRLLMALSGLVAAMRSRPNRDKSKSMPPPAAAASPRGRIRRPPIPGVALTPLQLRAKAEIDAALDAGRAADIRLPRRAGATYLAHVIHKERGGVVVSPNEPESRRFQEDHMRMFGERPNSMTASKAPHQLCGRRGPVVFDAFNPGQWPGQEEAAMHSRGAVLLWVDNTRQQIDPNLARTVRRRGGPWG